MVFFIDEARSRPPLPRLLTNVNKKMVFFIEGFPYLHEALYDFPYSLFIIATSCVQTCRQCLECIIQYYYLQSVCVWVSVTLLGCFIYSQI